MCKISCIRPLGKKTWDPAYGATWSGETNMMLFHTPSLQYNLDSLFLTASNLVLLHPVHSSEAGFGPPPGVSMECTWPLTLVLSCSPSPDILFWFRTLVTAAPALTTVTVSTSYFQGLKFSLNNQALACFTLDELPSFAALGVLISRSPTGTLPAPKGSSRWKVYWASEIWTKVTSPFTAASFNQNGRHHFLKMLALWRILFTS